MLLSLLIWTSRSFSWWKLECWILYAVGSAHPFQRSEQNLSSAHVRNFAPRTTKLCMVNLFSRVSQLLWAVRVCEEPEGLWIWLWDGVGAVYLLASIEVNFSKCCRQKHQCRVIVSYIRAKKVHSFSQIYIWVSFQLSEIAEPLYPAQKYPGVFRTIR